MASNSPLLSYWHPDVSYDFTLRIGKSDLSMDLVGVEIRSAVTIPYQHVFLDIFMDPRDILSEQLFGQESLKLTIRLLGKDGHPFGDPVDFELMYVDTVGTFAPAQQSYLTDQWERSIVTLKTVCSKPYQTMSHIVNAIYNNSTPDVIISDLLKQTNPKEIIYDPNGRSTLGIDQFLIPPTTIYNVVNYLDKTYGVFNGPLGFHCTFDNKVKIQNLAKKVNSAQAFTLYLLATDQDHEKFFGADESSFFYTQSAVISSYKGNLIFSVEAPTRRYIVKPRNTLYQTIDINLESFSKQYGIIEKNNPKIYYNKETLNSNKRIAYAPQQTGYDNDQTFINSNLSKMFADMSVVVAEITGNLPILNLMEVGEHVKIISQVDDHLKLGGAYILKGSDIRFGKRNTWDGLATVYLSRTNIAMQ